MTTTSQFLLELADREAIRGCQLRYARAVDRRDEDLLRSVYWPDATDDHLFFSGSVEDFVAWAMELLAGMDQTMHSLTNMLIEIDLPSARVETYFTAYHRRRDETGQPIDWTAGGRYLDRMEKRDDQWRIAERVMVLDWMTEYPDSGAWAARPAAEFKTNIWPDDLSYRLFGGKGVGEAR